MVSRSPKAGLALGRVTPPFDPALSALQTYTPSLAVVMGLIQVRHFKLWLAGNLRNWPLAEYQLSQMRATLHDCRVLFPNAAVADTSAISRSAEDFRDAIRTKTQPFKSLRQSATIATKGRVWNLSK